MPRSSNIMDDVIAYEEGRLDHYHTVRLFQQLVNTGLAWQLQGSYGRTAAAMIAAGTIQQPDSEEIYQ